jgi:putative ABC transport system substrate-binding protein
MRRRDFISAIAGSAAAWPLAAHAQQAGRLPTVGILGTGSASTQGQWNAAFVQRLRELGWIEGRTLVIETRWAKGRNERFADIAAEFVRLKTDVIVAAGTAPVMTVKRVTASIPIVAAIMGEPVGTGLVASLARPGGNVTGLSMTVPGLSSKRIELLREMVPSLRRLAIMSSVGNPNAAVNVSELQASAHALGLDVVISEVRRAEDIAPAIDSFKNRADALYVDGDPLMTTNRIRINTLAVGAKLPTLYVQRQYVEAGGLMSYGPNVPDLFRRAGEYVDKILRGTKPADIPIEQPTKFDLVINLTTAKALGLTIPEAFLLRADEVIE